MVIEVLVALNFVHTTVHNALIIKMSVPGAMMAITQALPETAHQSVYPDVKHACQEPRAHHARRDMITQMVKMIVVIITVLKSVIVIMVSVHHVRTDITITVIHVIVSVQATVSRARQIWIVDCV
jgi:hypothetical protein